MWNKGDFEERADHAGYIARLVVPQDGPLVDHETVHGYPHIPVAAGRGRVKTSVRLAGHCFATASLNTHTHSYHSTCPEPCSSSLHSETPTAELTDRRRQQQARKSSATAAQQVNTHTQRQPSPGYDKNM